KVVKLNKDWLVDTSEYAPSDEEVKPKNLPTTEQLDYALLRLGQAVGDEPIGSTNDPSAQKRGWIHLDAVADGDPPIGSPVVIVQHPKGDPLSFAIEIDGVLSVNKNSTRVRYRTNTEPGSSGSPVFDLEWKLIALHHAGDPDYSQFHKPGYNQGVLI